MKMYLILWLCLVQILLRSVQCSNYPLYNTNSNRYNETDTGEIKNEELTAGDNNDIRGPHVFMEKRTTKIHNIEIFSKQKKADFETLVTALSVNKNGIKETLIESLNTTVFDTSPLKFTYQNLIAKADKVASDHRTTKGQPTNTAKKPAEEHSNATRVHLWAKNNATFATAFPVKNSNYTHNEGDAFTVTEKQAAVQVPIPEPKHMFINYIAVESLVMHLTLEKIVIETVHSALAASTYFVRTESLDVHSLTTTTYKHTENGNTVMQVAYYVSYNHRVLHNTVVSKVLQSEEASATLHHHLASHGIKEYKLSHLKSWAKENATIIAISAVICALMLLLVIIVVVVKKRSSTKYDTKKRYVSAKDNEKLDKKKLASMYNNDLSNAFENPVYNFETNSVMDGRAMP